MKFETAKDYDKFAFAQKFVAEKLIRVLKFHRQNFGEIFEIGAGSGVLTRLILSELNYQNITLNDIYKSDFMTNFPTKIGDIRTMSLPPADLIISSSVFQWLSDLKSLSNAVKSALNSGGIFAFSMFINGTLREISAFTKQGLNYKTTAHLTEIFGENFEILSSESGEFMANFANLKALLTHLKKTGVNNISGNFRLNKTTLNALNSHFDGNFKLSYNYAIFILRSQK